MKNYRAWFVSVIILVILCLGSMLFVLGQGGTGRENPNANVKKNPSASTRKRSSKPKRASSSAPANDSAKQTSDQPRSNARADDERAYWESIKLSSNVQDFKAYLEKYPNGQFADPARDNLQRLEAKAKSPLKTDAAGRVILGSISGSSNEVKKPTSLTRFVVTNGIGMGFLYVPAGKFMMGSNNGKADEKPVHEVTIKEGFYISRYEVTQGQWRQVMGNNPSYHKGDTLPVEQVSWDDAEGFTSKLNERRDGFTYRLPTEAEWEYACRSKTIGDHAGDLKEMAWFQENSGSKTHTVGGKQSNTWGLADMHGNVWEWCADYYHESYDGAPSDGSPWLTGGEMNHRVFRGGAWNSEPPFLRSAARYKALKIDRYYSVGFRVVATSTVK